MADKRGRRKNEDLIKLDDVPRLLLELTGVTRCRSTVYQWVVKGRLNYTDSAMIKLKVSTRLGRYYTTRAWVEEFIKAIS